MCVTLLEVLEDSAKVTDNAPPGTSFGGAIRIWTLASMI